MEIRAGLREDSTCQLAIFRAILNSQTLDA